MDIIRPNAITNAMLLYSSVAEPDTVSGETAWSATEIGAIGDERYVGSPSGTVTVTAANPAVVSMTAHGLVADTPGVFTNSGGALPTGITSGTTYFVSEVLTDGTFTFSETVGGRRVRCTDTGSGTHTFTAKVHKVFRAIAGQRGTFTADAGTDFLTYAGHGFAADTPVVATNSGGGLPGGLTAGTTYYVKAPTTDTFQLAATAGGSAINITTAGTGTHSIGLEENYNKPPLQNETVWTYLAPTNRWAALDSQLGSVCSNYEYLRIDLQPGRFNALALLEASASTVGIWLQINRAAATFTHATDKVNMTAHGFAAGTAVVLFRADPSADTMPAGLTEGLTYYVINPGANDFEVSLTVGGAAVNFTSAGTGTFTGGKLVYTRSLDLVDDTNVGNWYQYFYEPVYQQDTVAVTELVDATLLDLPAYGEAILTVVFEREDGMVQCGQIIPGLVANIGKLLDKPRIRRKTYSRVVTDEYGNTSITRRSNVKRFSGVVKLAREDTDRVNNVMGVYLDTPVVFIADKSITSLIVYGIAKDYDISPESATVSMMTLEVEGMN